MYRRIMVGTDGSEYSDKAVDHALELCRATGAELLAVSVVNMEVLECIENSDRDVYCKVQDSLEQRANDILSRVEEKAAKENVPVKKIIQVGDPAEVLVELAKREGADLIVVGTGTRGSKEGDAWKPRPKSRKMVKRTSSSCPLKH